MPWAKLVVLFVAVTVGAAALLPATGTVLAHANLARANPAPNSVLEEPPNRVSVWFTEPIEPSLSEIRVLNAAGSRVDDAAYLADPNEPTVLSVGLEPLPNGTYTVAWKNVSTIDGHRVRGAFVFSVGEPITGAPAELPDEPLLQSPAEPVLRWLILLGALTMVGGLVFDLLVLRPVLAGRQASGNVRRVGEALVSRSSRLIWPAWAIFVAASIVQLLLQAAASHEVSIAETLGGPLWSLLADTAWGRLWLWRIGLSLVFAAALVALVLPVGWLAIRLGSERIQILPRVLALGLGGAVLWTLSLTSHGAATADIRSAALASDYLHLLASAFWVGALIHLALGLPLLRRSLSSSERRTVLASLVPRFSVLAALSVCTLVVTGVFNGWAQVTVASAVATPYGLALVAKVLLVVALLSLAGLNLLWVRPRLARDSNGERWLGKFVFGEVVLALLVLASVGFLTSVEPARQIASREMAADLDAPVFQDTVEGTSIRLEVAPGTVGPNDFTVSLNDRQGSPINTASDVSLHITYLDADLGEEATSAVPLGKGSYALQGHQLSIAGAWQAVLIVRRPDAFDARTAFRFEVTGAGPAGSSAIAPSPETAKLLLGAGIALLGVLFMGAGLPLGGGSLRPAPA